VAEWLCSGLQSRGRRFDSDPSLHLPFPWGSNKPQLYPQITSKYLILLYLVPFGL
jgi:hypothetical protein